MKKIHLIDRILLSGMIPSQGSWAQDKVWGDCKKKLDITSEEVQRHGIQMSQAGIQWKSEIDCKLDGKGEEISGTGIEFSLIGKTDTPIKFPLTDKEVKICKFATSLKKLERSEEGLPSTHVDLYETFVGAAPIDLDFMAAEAERLEAAEDQAYEDSLTNDEADKPDKK